MLFTQKRVEKDKEIFMLHKFRSIKMKPILGVPTHQLKNPEQYVTRIENFLRKYSLDGSVIIGQTTKNIENRGFCEVYLILFNRVFYPPSISDNEVNI